MTNKELIEKLEKRERDYRKKIGEAKKEGDAMLEKYFQGHVHEIENLLFQLKEA